MGRRPLDLSSIEMTVRVYSVERDLSGKWLARVAISEEESAFIKFPEYPSMAEIQKSAEQLLDELAARVASQERVDATPK